MLPTVFNELLMGINVRILNEILSLALYMYIKKHEKNKNNSLTALFFLMWGPLSPGTVCGKQVFAARIANAFLMKYLSDKLVEKR